MQAIPLFYVPNLSGQIIDLPEDESKHCIRVLRMDSGKPINIVDGKGNLYRCTVAEPHPKRCRVQVQELISGYGKRHVNLHVAIAPTKSNDRFEWFIEKATEVGVDTITPILCQRSERRMVSHERMERVAIAAMKQSEKAYLPILNPLTPFDTLVRDAFLGVRLIAHFNQGVKTHVKERIGSPSVLVLIGPEGDFSPQEVERALGAGFEAVSLGSSRLRTETAGVVACTLLNIAPRS